MGVGMKESDLKDLWDVEQGVSYIPWNRIPENVDDLAEGGFLDEDSLPEEVKSKCICHCGSIDCRPAVIMVKVTPVVHVGRLPLRCSLAMGSVHDTYGADFTVSTSEIWTQCSHMGLGESISTSVSWLGCHATQGCCSPAFVVPWLDNICPLLLLLLKWGKLTTF